SSARHSSSSGRVGPAFGGRPMIGGPIIGRSRGGDLAKQRAKELGISRATWFRRVKNGLIEKPPTPPNEAARQAAWNKRREERAGSCNPRCQNRVGEMA